MVKLADAGWSSLVARRAHNPKVIGSNPIPATKKHKHFRKWSWDAFFLQFRAYTVQLYAILIIFLRHSQILAIPLNKSLKRTKTR